MPLIKDSDVFPHRLPLLLTLLMITPHAWADSAPLPELGTGESPYRVTLFDPRPDEDQQRLWSQTKLIAGLGVGVAGFIAMLPEDVSNWDRSDDRLLEKWWDNVRSGPVWDKDDFWINYIGHPYFGGVYYQVARKSGFNQWNSFTYSALMSTFYWEYGLEAFAEVPSIQDLVVTPVGGWLYGEWAFQTEREIRRNGGKAMGSESMGSVALFLLDPVDNIGSWINGMMGRDVIRTGSIRIATRPTYFRPAYRRPLGDYWGIDIVLLTR